MDILLAAWEYSDLPLLTFLIGYLALPRPAWADKAAKWISEKIR